MAVSWPSDKSVDLTKRPNDVYRLNSHITDPSDDWMLVCGTSCFVFTHRTEYTAAMIAAAAAAVAKQRRAVAKRQPQRKVEAFVVWLCTHAKRSAASLHLAATQCLVTGQALRNEKKLGRSNNWQRGLQSLAPRIIAPHFRIIRSLEDNYT